MEEIHTALRLWPGVERILRTVSTPLVIQRLVQSNCQGFSFSLSLSLCLSVSSLQFSRAFCQFLILLVCLSLELWRSEHPVLLRPGLAEQICNLSSVHMSHIPNNCTTIEQIRTVISGLAYFLRLRLRVSTSLCTSQPCSKPVGMAEMLLAATAPSV